MHHEFANQELARLSYAEAIRNSHPARDVAHEVEERITRSPSLLNRLREAVGEAFSLGPEARPTS